MFHDFSLEKKKTLLLFFCFVIYFQMSNGLPVGGFRWLAWDDVESEGFGCFLEVDLEYPLELHDEHNDFPLAPESLVLNEFPKLTQNLQKKKRIRFFMGKT